MHQHGRTHTECRTAHYVRRKMSARGDTEDRHCRRGCHRGNLGGITGSGTTQDVAGREGERDRCVPRGKRRTGFGRVDVASRAGLENRAISTNDFLDRHRKPDGQSRRLGGPNGVPPA